MSFSYSGIIGYKGLAEQTETSGWNGTLAIARNAPRSVHTRPLTRVGTEVETAADNSRLLIDNVNVYARSVNPHAKISYNNTSGGQQASLIHKTNRDGEFRYDMHRVVGDHALSRVPHGTYGVSTERDNNVYLFNNNLHRVIERCTGRQIITPVPMANIHAAREFELRDVFAPTQWERIQGLLAPAATLDTKRLLDIPVHRVTSVTERGEVNQVSSMAVTPLPTVEGKTVKTANYDASGKPAVDGVAVAHKVQGTRALHSEVGTGKSMSGGNGGTDDHSTVRKVLLHDAPDHGREVFARRAQSHMGSKVTPLQRVREYIQRMLHTTAHSAKTVPYVNDSVHDKTSARQYVDTKEPVRASAVTTKAMTGHEGTAPVPESLSVGLAQNLQGSIRGTRSHAHLEPTLHDKTTVATAGMRDTGTERLNVPVNSGVSAQRVSNVHHGTFTPTGTRTDNMVVPVHTVRQTLLPIHESVHECVGSCALGRRVVDTHKVKPDVPVQKHYSARESHPDPQLPASSALRTVAPLTPDGGYFN